MKKTIQLTAKENLISTYDITPYFNTLLNIPLSFKKKKFKITSNKINTPFIAANKILFIFHYLFPFLNQ